MVSFFTVYLWTTAHRLNRKGSNKTQTNAELRTEQQACVTYFASFVSYVCCYIFQWLRTLSIGVFFFSGLIKKINKNCIFADFVASWRHKPQIIQGLAFRWNLMIFRNKWRWADACSGDSLSHIYDPELMISMDHWNWLNTLTRTHTHTHAQRTWRVCMRRIWALGVHGSYPLGDATLSECGRHSYSALLDQRERFGVHQPDTPESVGELVKVQDSAGREISNNQKPRMYNVHLYHNILTLLLLLLLFCPARQHLCSMCLS